MENLSLILALLGVFFTILGILSGHYPPKKINAIYGYRTRRSMRNQETWDFANRLSARMMLITGTVLALIGFGLWGLGYSLHVIWFLILVWATILYLIVSVERQLKRRFDEQGQRRKGN